jgi:hypothetical protein
MELEPRNLNISLHHRRRLWPKVVAGVLLTALVSYVVFPPWGKAFMAAALLALPVFLLMLASQRSAAPLRVAALVAYLFVAKRYLLPLLLGYL